MFELAFVIGIYAYLIFILGILGLLFKTNVIIVSLLYLLVVFAYFVKIKRNLKLPKIRFDKTSWFLILLIIGQSLVNFVGVLGPEISFDSLWYHLTLPKLYLINHAIFHIPGNLLYYSDMSKLMEMLYVGGLSFDGETITKFTHFLFVLLVLVLIYKISRKFLSQKFSLLAVVIFYSSLVVGWESITAYVDLGRTFFELLAFWGFLTWYEKKSLKWIVISGLMLGLAIATKIVAVSSIVIFFALFLYSGYLKKEATLKIVKNLFRFRCLFVNSSFTLVYFFVSQYW